MKILLNVYFYFLFWPFIVYYWQSSKRYDRKQAEREGEWHVAKGTQAGTWTLDHRSKDKASAHGTLTLPNELNNAP